MNVLRVVMAMAGVLSLGWAATLSVASAQSKEPAKTQAAPTPNKWQQHYHDRIAQFEQENAAARNIVMVGSSHVEGFDGRRLLPGRRIINRGIASDHIGIGEQGVLHRLDSSVFDCNPGFIFLENGVNDLGDLRRMGKPSVDEIETCYREVVKRMRTRLPTIPLVVVALFPTRDKYAELTPLIVEFNRRLKKIANDFDCPFMDAYGPLADDKGLLRVDYSRDGLHLNEAGYQVWAKLIDAVLPPFNPTQTQPD